MCLPTANFGPNGGGMAGHGELACRMAFGLEELVAAVCPPSVTALGVVPSVARAARQAIEATAPVQRLVLRAALRALSAQLPVPAALAREVRRLLVVAAYEQPAVHAALGYDPVGWIEGTAARRVQRWGEEIRAHELVLVRADPLVPGSSSAPRPGRFTSARDIPEREVGCDAVVVGSGAGGAVVAAELAEAGWHVVVLEEGPHVRTEEFSTDALTAFRTLYRDGGLTAMLGTPPVGYAEGRCVGGSTTVNGGMAWRTPEPVLARWRETHGVDVGDLGPVFDRIERRLSVGLQDADSIGRDQHLLKVGAERLGWAVVDNRRAQVHCGGCNACVLGCPTGAKQSTLVSYLPRAVAFGTTVVCDCRVERVLFDGKQARGVRAVGPDGGRIVVRAPVVVLAAGALHTPVLLHRSGFRSPSGQLGRNLAVHPGANVAALFDDPVEGWKGVHQAYQVREFEGVLMAAVNLPPGLVAGGLRLDRHELGAVMARYDRILTAGVLVDDTSTGRVFAVGGRPVVRYDLSPGDARRLIVAVADLCRLLFSAGATRIHLPVAGMAALESADDGQRLLDAPIAPGRLAVSTVHLMGTARMGGDPTRTVCDSRGRLHDAAGLFIADAGLLPTPLGVNPQETVMALATRVAEGLITATDRKEPA
jgi:choline dehydrogenase-like flavoprotein